MSGLNSGQSAPPTQDEPAVVLLVDDQAIVGEAIRRFLAAESWIDFHYCAEPRAALELADRIRPSVILQDLVMPGIDGLDLVRGYRANASTRQTPIIVLSTKEEAAIKSAAFAAGATDYLVKLPDAVELIARLRHHSRAYRNQLERDEAHRALRDSQVQLQLANNELKRIDQMKSEFVSTVSHELRTPLTSIRGSLGLIAGGVAGPLPEAAKKLVDIARSNCDRLIRLINDLLDAEKIQAGSLRLELEVSTLKPLLMQAIAANEGFASEHGVRLSLQAADETLRVNVDRDRLAQIVTNLLSNAMKFSPKGATVEVLVLRREGRVRVEIRDQGPGISEEFRGRIFQKFSQADSSDTRLKGGTGLGLNISRALVEALGGTIGFASELGKGSVFFFELPEWAQGEQ